MKNIVKSGWLCICLLAAFSVQAQFTKATLQASGLTCAMCTKAIDNALKQVPFVASVKPNIKNSAFEILFKDNMEADADVLKKAVEDAGFFVAKLKFTGVFDKVPVKNDEHVRVGTQVYHFLNVKDQVLTGEQSLTIVDKNFLTLKEFKKYSTASAMTCVQTGKASDCCTKEGLTPGSRIYHVTNN
jgi:copper chaperone CopZ